MLHMPKRLTANDLAQLPPRVRADLRIGDDVEMPDGRLLRYEGEPRRPGRPVAGRTPDHERSARSKQALLESGGRRLTVNLAAESVEAIEHIKRVEGFTTDREAIEHALQHTSDLARRRERLTRRK